DAVDVIARIHRIHFPEAVFVEGTEQDQLDDDPPLPGLGDEVRQAAEVGGVPAAQVELRAAVRGAGRLAAGPWAGVAARGRGKRVLLDLERPGHLAIGAGEGPGQVEAAGPQLVQV